MRIRGTHAARIAQANRDLHQTHDHLDLVTAIGHKPSAMLDKPLQRTKTGNMLYRAAGLYLARTACPIPGDTTSNYAHEALQDDPSQPMAGCQRHTLAARMIAALEAH